MRRDRVRAMGGGGLGSGWGAGGSGGTGGGSGGDGSGTRATTDGRSIQIHRPETMIGW